MKPVQDAECAEGRSNGRGILRWLTNPDQTRTRSRQFSMAKLQIESDLPDITPAQSLAGWHREFCVELLEDRTARVFVRAVETGSFKAAELQRAILFHRLGPRFTDLAGCVAAVRSDLERLVDTSRRERPESGNLYRAVEYDRTAWERVRLGLDRWARRSGR
jgi:hypothetical protein